MSKTKKSHTVYVHAYEHVNGTSAGGGGFDWYFTEATARKAFTDGNYPRDVASPKETADFFFTFETSHNPRGADRTRQKITDAIDDQLHDLTAKAKDRRVGATVLRYWRNNKFKMGGAKRPSRVA